MSNFKQLQQIIIEHSNNTTNWNDTISEWKLLYVTKGNSNCLCGKEISNLCHIQNVNNLTEFVIGNECIKKICPNDEIKGKTLNLFECISKLKKDNSKAPNKVLISYSKQQGILTEWEEQFSLNTYRKRKLSEKQLYWRIEINKKILANIKV